MKIGDIVYVNRPNGRVWVILSADTDKRDVKAFVLNIGEEWGDDSGGIVDFSGSLNDDLPLHWKVLL